MDFDDTSSRHLGQHTVDGLTKGAIYALVALGYTLVYGVLRLINFAHSEVFMVGTFAVLGTWTAAGRRRQLAASGWSIAASRCCGLVVAAIASGGHRAGDRAARLPAAAAARTRRR